jgi:hypothetical protein
MFRIGQSVVVIYTEAMAIAVTKVTPYSTGIDCPHHEQPRGPVRPLLRFEPAGGSFSSGHTLQSTGATSGRIET